MEEQVIEHRPAQMFDMESKWCAPCSCGDKFTAPSPSGATAKLNKHIEAANKKASRQANTDATPARAKNCGCGCGEALAARAGGLFRSGHDARFKSILTEANAGGKLIRHPLTGEEQEPLQIADWLDERRGVGSFWRDKVLAGHKPKPEVSARPKVVADDTEDARRARSHARVDSIMDYNANRRPVPGDMGVVTLKSGPTYGARVLRRENDDALAVRFTDGPKINTEVVIPDHRFTRSKKMSDVRV